MNWTLPQQIEHRKVDPYRYFNYAVLHTVGVDVVFNLMRYDTAFLARRSDYEMLLEASEGDNYADWMMRNMAILLCRYDWSGKTKAHWTPAMLMSNQSLEEVSDPQALYELGADQTELRAPSKPTLKWEHTLEVKGSLQYVLQVMYENKATPADEGSAHQIERAFYPYQEKEPITVKLRNFLGVQTEWRLPQQ